MDIVQANTIVETVVLREGEGVRERRGRERRGKERYKGGYIE